jgi:hypothetical protein
LLDAEIVRWNLGASALDGGGWASAEDACAELNRDGVIDIADLTLAIARYEHEVSNASPDPD